MSEEPGRRTRAGAEVDPHLRNFTILVADDSRTMRKIFTMELEALGFSNILQAHDGQQAMDTVRTKAIDLLLLDMEMPEMDGLEVLAAIKGDEQLKSLPVIVISGAEEVAKAIRCIETGAEDYLPKPFDPVLLRARIVSSLEKKRLRDLEIRNMAMLAHEKQLVELEQMKTERLMLNILPARDPMTTSASCSAIWWASPRCRAPSVPRCW
jgi:CheY-like chemotaxis protein